MAKSFTLHKSAHCPHSAVKWPHWVRKKYRYEILGIFDQILRMDCLNYCFIVKLRSFLVIFTNFDVFKIAISKSTCMNSLKIRQICISHKIWIDISQL